MRLPELIPRDRAAVVISEMQRGIVGDLAPPVMRQLAEAVRADGLAPRLARFAAAARARGVPVVHATLQFRPGHVGQHINTPLLAATVGRDAGYLAEGSAAAEIVDELTPHSSDVVHARRHGMSAFTGTDLDAVLRSLGVEALVIGGVSANEAVIGMAIEAVNLGYRVAVLRDGVGGLPATFVNDMFEHVFRLLGATPTMAEALEAWSDTGAVQAPAAG